MCLLARHPASQSAVDRGLLLHISSFPVCCLPPGATGITRKTLTKSMPSHAYYEWFLLRFVFCLVLLRGQNKTINIPWFIWICSTVPSSFPCSSWWHNVIIVLCRRCWDSSRFECVRRRISGRLTCLSHAPTGKSVVTARSIQNQYYGQLSRARDMSVPKIKLQSNLSRGRDRILFVSIDERGRS